MKGLAKLVARLRQQPLPMGTFKERLEQALEGQFALRLVTNEMLTRVTTGEEILVYDVSYTLPQGQGLRVQRDEEVPEKPHLEELALLPVALQRLDERCRATIRRNGKNRSTVLINRKLESSTERAARVQVRAFHLTQSNYMQLLSPMVSFLQNGRL